MNFWQMAVAVAIGFYGPPSLFMLLILLLSSFEDAKRGGR